LQRDVGNIMPLDRAPRLARLTGFFDRRAEPEQKSAFGAAVEVLAARGAEVVRMDDPIEFDQILAEHRLVMAAEAARIHSDWLNQSPEDYPPRIRALIQEGNAPSAQDYLRAKDGMRQAQRALHSSLSAHKVDAMITPATIGMAPDVSTTGEPAFNSLWTYSDLPAVSFPSGLSGDGMPLAVQLVGYSTCDLGLLGVALWCEQAIRTARQ